MWDRAALTVPEDDIDWETVVQSAAAFHNMHTPNQHTASPFETVFRQLAQCWTRHGAWRPLGLPYNKDVELRVNATLQSRAGRQQRRAKQRSDRAANGKRPASWVAFDVGQAVWALIKLPAAHPIIHHPSSSPPSPVTIVGVTGAGQVAVEADPVQARRAARAIGGAATRSKQQQQVGMQAASKELCSDHGCHWSLSHLSHASRVVWSWDPLGP
jgi:hypothetical protein